jgi:DNA-binding HxlR family transcriptional regulator
MMNHKDFIKCTSTDNKLKILNMLFDEEKSVYDMLPHIDLTYKNIYEIFRDFYKLGIIEQVLSRQPPHYAIKYKITKKGKYILSVLELVKNI